MFTEARKEFNFWICPSTLALQGVCDLVITGFKKITVNAGKII